MNQPFLPNDKVEGDVFMKIKVSYHTVNSTGLPEGPQKYEQVEINPDLDDGVGTLVEEALSKKLNVRKSKLKILRMT